MDKIKLPTRPPHVKQARAAAPDERAAPERTDEHRPGQDAPASNTGIPFGPLAAHDSLRIEALTGYLNGGKTAEEKVARLLAATTDLVQALRDLAGGEDRPVSYDLLWLERMLLARRLHQVSQDRTVNRELRKAAAKAVMALTNAPRSIFFKRIGVEGRREKAPAGETPTPAECRQVLRDTQDRLYRLWPASSRMSPTRAAKLCDDLATAFPDVAPERLPSVDDLKSRHLRKSRLAFRLAAARLNLKWNELRGRLKQA